MRKKFLKLFSTFLTVSLLLSTSLFGVINPFPVHAAVIFSDSFTGANGSSLGANWTEQLGNAQIQNNQAVGKTLTSDNFNLDTNPEFTTNASRYNITNSVVARADCSSSPNIAPTGGTDNYCLSVTNNGRAAWYANSGTYPTVGGVSYIASTQAYAPSANTTVNPVELLITCGAIKSKAITVEDAWQTLTLDSARCTGGGEVWLRNTGSAGDVVYFDAVSIKAQLALVTHDHGTGDVDVTAKMTTPGSGTIVGGIVSRWSSPGNYWLLRITYGAASNNVQLVQVNNYVETIWQQATFAWSVSTQYTIRLVNAGSTYTAYVNGVQQLTFTDAREFNKTQTNFGLLFSDTSGFSWDDWSASTATGGTDTATLAYSANQDLAAPALPSSGTFYYVSPTGTAGGDGSRANPWDIVTGVNNISAGQYLVFLDGVYTIAAGGYTLKGSGSGTITYIADQAARPIITDSNGHAPTITFGANIVVKYLWFGGSINLAYNQQEVVAGGNGATWYGNTFFNYKKGGVFVEGSNVGNTYTNNRFVDTGGDNHQHPFYMTNTSGTGSVIRGSIIVGGEGYLQIQGANGYTAQKNFIGDNLYGIWLQNSSHLIVDHNIVWSTTSIRDGAGGVSTSTYNYNIFGKWTGSDSSVSIGDHNVFVDGAPTPFGTNQTLWALTDVPTYLTVTGAQLDAAVVKLETVFAQTTQQIHDDTTINHYFQTIRTALDSWPHLTSSSLAQYKSDGTISISSTNYTNETSVVFKFGMSSSDASDTLTPKIEIQENGTAFTGTATNNGSSVAYSGSPVTGTVTVTGLTSGKTYHWQAQAINSIGNGSFVAMGGNPDFGVDTVAPTTTDNVDSSWHNSGVNVTLTCSDTGGSGCLHTYYTTDGTNPNTSSTQGTSFTLSTAGTYTIKYFSTDNAGNQESIKTASNTIKISTTAPTSSSSLSPSGYTKDNTKPTLIFKKSTNSVSGIASYSVSLDSGKNRSFLTSGIPANGNGSADYVWKDDSSVKVEFLNENDSDSSNDEIHVYFKDLNNQELSEGKHTWTVTTYDNAGNSTSQSADFYIDRTSPVISELAIANVSTVLSGVSYNLDITNRMPSFSGLASDNYQGSTVTNSNGSKDTFDKVSSGPKTITLTFKKFKSGDSLTSSNATYTDYSTKDLTLSDIKDNGDQKSTRFYITTPFPLVDGDYQVKLSLKDNADNNYDYSVFYISINSSKPNLIQNLFDNNLETQITEQTTIPFQEPTNTNCQTYTVKSGDTLWSISQSLLGNGNKYQEIIDQNKDAYPSLESSNSLKAGWELKVNCNKQETVKKPEKTPETQTGYDVKIKVVDTNKKPVESAKVTIHSKVQETTTDKNGIALFNSVEPGQHKILIAYSGYSGEQSVNLTGDVKEFDFNIQVKQTNAFLNHQVILVIGIMAFIILVTVVLLIKAKRKV